MHALAVSFLMLGLIACGGAKTTAPDPTAWAAGTWTAVRMDGKPLPYKDSPSFPYTQTDSVTIIVLTYSTPATAAVYPTTVLYFNAVLAPSPILCWEPFGHATITSASFSTRAIGAFTAGGSCNTSWVTFDLTRKGDTLSGTWSGKSVQFVKRSS